MGAPIGNQNARKYGASIESLRASAKAKAGTTSTSGRIIRGFVENAWKRDFKDNVKEDLKAAGITGTEAEDIAVTLESYIGMDYTSINGGLRKGIVTDRVERIDKYLSVAPVLPEWTPIYRGISVNKDIRDSLVSGAIIQDKGFQSTSISERQAQHFLVMSSNEQSNKGVLFVYDKHSSAVSLNTRYEQEVLIPRDTKFKITDIYHKETDSGFKYKEVHLEQV